ncbi:hypothetical protein [Paenibacillus radicis (ex Xue et al. 2023)]|uniref:Uncharacterized protein n=1 Tax=Paenibacillus radicis (ex Xue et al. 2023) TaxID=2972489 RepID=A0ABT1YVD6_9BACL|nr:hypothetical protein [Paenibacillus radicis (ex Xue et al. 2023)]MCR8636919.1 hypothetical protein [Paenibacillus radicis (ex Xue et al. 2023)]
MNITQRTGIMILMLLGTLACSNDQVIHHNGITTANMTTANSEHSNQKPAYRPDLFPESAAIPFDENLGQPLESGAPPTGAKLFKSFALPQSDAEVLVYTSGDDSAGLTGYLKGRNSEWKLGDLSSFNVNQDWIHSLNSLTGDVSGAVMEIPFGSIGAKKGLLIYHHNSDSWNVVDFQGHPAIPLDLDNDGVPEWIGNQTDWVPPALEIHRWVAEHDRFESTVLQWSSLFPDTDNEAPSYSALFTENGEHLIQIGNSDAYAFFTYDQGVLKQCRPADTRDRVLEMQMARHH